MDASEAKRLAAQFAEAHSRDQQAALIDALLATGMPNSFDVPPTPEPELLPPPEVVRGFRIRLDLDGAKPPVWRRIEVPGDVTLDRLHEVIQVAMGWWDGHLHRFRTARDYRSPQFVTRFDLEEGDEGVLEDDARLDQVVSTVGDVLWYEYDFGDGWDHVLKVEKVLDEAPSRARCLAGAKACPPEDCGGIGGHAELAAWVRSGDDDLLPAVFEDVTHAREWLPRDWHPDHFDVDETDEALAGLLAEPIAVGDDLARILADLEVRGVRRLHQLLARPVWHEPASVSDAEAASLTQTYRTFLEIVGDGVTLTAAGFMPPSTVERFARDSGIADWWIGKANREDLTPPVARVRTESRELGLVSVRKGRLSPTAAGRRGSRNPQALWQRIVDVLPLGRSRFDRTAGWVALAVIGSGVPAEEWNAEISGLLASLGWRYDNDPYAYPSAHSPTLSALETLGGVTRTDELRTGAHPAVAATARAAALLRA